MLFKRQKKLAQNTYQHLKGYIGADDSVLDVGFGSGLVGEQIQRKIGAKLKGIDVVDVSRTDLRPIIFDGCHIPFPDSAFTVALCSFVLHHTRHQRELLAEMKRVAHSTIIIFEDIPKNILERILVRIHALLSVFAFKSEPLFRHDSDWKDLFRDCGLEVVYEENISKKRDWAYWVSRKMYILKESSSI